MYRMFDSAGDILSVLEHYKYFIIFPITIIEGPIIMIVSGFLVYLGHMNFWVVYPLLIFADMLGDIIYHTIGRFWRSSERARQYASYFGYSNKSEEFLDNLFKKHELKTLLLAKFAHGIGAVIQISSGIAKVDFFQFVLFSFLSTLPKTLILMLIGFYAGSSLSKIDGYLSVIALVTISIFATIIIGYILLNKKIKKFFNNK